MLNGATNRPAAAGRRYNVVCANGRKVYIATIEKAVLEGLREQLAQRDAIDVYVKTYNEERRRLAKAPDRSVRA
jgi:site-specific DNA recombinase